MKSIISITIISVISGFFAAIFGQPLIYGNDQAINVIVTVFSILAGFLIAIIAIIGDPLLLSPGSWRRSEHRSTIIRKRLVRQKYLFLMYLIVLILIFISTLTKESYGFITVWVERVYLFLATCAFILSLKLPFALVKMQQDRIDSIIDAKREKAGISSKN
jgi:hypothetical protein